MDQMRLKEIREAIDAGNRALRSLQQARAELNSASNFGLADMLGFDLLGGIGKHMKYSKAKECMAEAQANLKRFEKEIMDVNNGLDFNIEMGTFWTVADFLFDGVLADIFVQSKISDAKVKVDQAANQVQYMLNRLCELELEEMNR